VVEGHAYGRDGDDVPNHSIRIAQHIPCGDPQSPDSMHGEQSIPLRVTYRSVAAIMHLTIHLNRKPRRSTVEIEHERPRRMLPPELHTRRSGPQHSPQRNFRHRHGSTQSPRVAHCLPRLVEHRAGPSTMLRMVPLPETSSGRI
jgi:hypothetical protein